MKKQKLLEKVLLSSKNVQFHDQVKQFLKIIEQYNLKLGDEECKTITSIFFIAMRMNAI